MTNLADLTTAKLRRIVAIKDMIKSLQGQIASITVAFNEQIEKLQGEIDSILGGGKGGIQSSLTVDVAKRRRMAAAPRAKIAAGARARWARIKGTVPSTPKPVKKKNRRSSPSFRAKLSAAARARWRKARAAGKKML